MAVWGNVSTSEAVNLLMPVTFSFTPLGDGTINDVFAHILFGLNVTGINVGGIATPVNPPGSQYNYFTLGPVGPFGHVTGGNLYGVTLSAIGAGGSAEVGGVDMVHADIWGDITYDVVIPSAPLIPATGTPASLSSWPVTYTRTGTMFLTSLQLQRSSDNGATWTTVDTFSSPPIGGSKTFVDTGVPAGPLQYRALAVTGAGSTPGPVLTVTAPPVTPFAPIIALPGSGHPLSMTSWLVGLGPGTDTKTSQWDLQRSIDNGSTWTTAGSITAVIPGLYTDAAVPAGPLQYRIAARNSVGDTIGPAAIATAPQQPLAPILTALSLTTWDVFVGSGLLLAAQYVIQRSQDGGATWTTINISPVIGTHTTDSVAPGALQYQLLAQNSVGSTASLPVVATSPGLFVVAPSVTEVLV